MGKRKKAHRGKAGGRLRRLCRLRAMERNLLKTKNFDPFIGFEEARRRLLSLPEATKAPKPITKRHPPPPPQWDPLGSPVPRGPALEQVPARKPTRPYPLTIYTRKSTLRPDTSVPREIKAPSQRPMPRVTENIVVHYNIKILPSGTKPV